MKINELRVVKLMSMSLTILFLLLSFSYGTAATTTYTYDNLNRLTGAITNDGTLTASYTYDNVGNRLSMGIQGLQLEIPSVTDSGEYSLDTTQLDLNSTLYDPKFGNLIYHYALGTSCELTDIQDWSEFFPDENGNVLLETLNLPYGELFISVRMLNFAGEIVSENGCSDGTLILDPLGDNDNDTFNNSTEHGIGSNPLNFNSRPGDTAIHLYSGFNMIAIPTDLSYPADLRDVLPLIGSSLEINEVLAPNKQTANYVSLRPENPLNPEHILHGGEGLIVYGSQEKEINFTTVLCVDLDLKQGVNLIGVSCPPVGYTAAEFLLDVGIENISSIQRFNSESGFFETIGFDANGAVVGNDFPIVRGEGYFVYMKQGVLGFRLEERK